MNTQPRHAFFAFGAIVVLCMSAAAAAVLPDRAAEATDLGIVDVSTLSTLVWGQP